MYHGQTTFSNFFWHFYDKNGERSHQSTTRTCSLQKIRRWHYHRKTVKPVNGPFIRVFEQLLQQLLAEMWNKSRKFLDTKLIRLDNTFITEVHQKETKFTPHHYAHPNGTNEMQSTATLAEPKEFRQTFQRRKSYSRKVPKSRLPKSFH